MTEDEYKILEVLFMTPWTDKRANSRMKKCEAIYEMSKAAGRGCILELGAHRGRGAISAAFGARAGNKVPIFTVDTHSDRRGWAGERYCQQDKARFLDYARLAGVYVTLISMDVDEACLGWYRPISLLLWDIGGKDRLRDDFLRWGRYVIPGGVFSIGEGDIKGQCQFGSEEIMAMAVKGNEWEVGKQYPEGHVYTLKKLAWKNLGGNPVD